MSDLISRQAAIEAITDELDRIDHVPQWVFDRLEGRLKQLPPAQLGTNLAEVGADCISRQAAIDAINIHFGFNIEEEYGSAVQEVINGLPPAQPEVRPIDYQDCSNAMLKMWMDNVLTDGEYNKIMDKLNDFERKRREKENG